jgi:hypothetical protein
MHRSRADLSEALMALCGWRAAARSGRVAVDRCREAAAGEALKASAPGIEMARPAAAPRTIVRIFAYLARPSLFCCFAALNVQGVRG